MLLWRGGPYFRVSPLKGLLANRHTHRPRATTVVRIATAMATMIHGLLKIPKMHRSSGGPMLRGLARTGFDLYPAGSRNARITDRTRHGHVGFDL